MLFMKVSILYITSTKLRWGAGLVEEPHDQATSAAQAGESQPRELPQVRLGEGGPQSGAAES